MKILMVCLGNICRSPLAEGILKHKASEAGLNWQIESSGTNGYNNGCPPHRLSRKIATLNGINIDQQISKEFNAADMMRFDKIYAMSTDVIENMRSIAGNQFDSKKVSLLMDELFPGENVEVPDPWYGTEPDYHQVYKLIDSACKKIIEKYGATAHKGSAPI